jgi:hypothetical protein
MARWRPSGGGGARALGAAVLAAALAGCAAPDGDRDGGGGSRRDEADVLGGVLGDILGGGGGGLGDILGGGAGGGGGLGGLLGGRGATYRCEDDLAFTASFAEGGRLATVETRRRTYELRLEDEYRGRREYRDAGGDARLTVDDRRADLRIEGDKDFRDCEPVR